MSVIKGPGKVIKIVLGVVCGFIVLCLLYPVVVFNTSAKYVPANWKNLPTSNQNAVERAIGVGDRGFGEEVWRRSFWWGSQQLHVSYNDETSDQRVEYIYCIIHLNVTFGKEHTDDENPLGNIYAEQFFPANSKDHQPKGYFLIPAHSLSFTAK